MMPLMVDWSWGQKYDVVPSPALGTGFPRSESNVNASPEREMMDGVKQQSFEQQNEMRDLFAHGWRIDNDYRVAVPNEAPKSALAPEGAAFLPATGKRVAPAQSKAGRKRSCAEISNDDEDSDSSLSRNTTTSSSDASSGSPLKEGYQAMTGMQQNGNTGFADELAERLRSSSVEEKRPGLGESRKSIRLDHGPRLAEQEANARGDVMFDAAPVSGDAALPATHDEATLALGVGWSNIPSTPPMLAAARGWARYVEMTFPLRSAKVVWRNEGMACFLVSAAGWDGCPGYWLFDEGLSQGKLVAKSWERCLDNLRSWRFDGVRVMCASEGGAVGSELEVVEGLDAGQRIPEIAMEVD